MKNNTKLSDNIAEFTLMSFEDEKKLIGGFSSSYSNINLVQMDAANNCMGKNCAANCDISYPANQGCNSHTSCHIGQG